MSIPQSRALRGVGVDIRACVRMKRSNLGQLLMSSERRKYKVIQTCKQRGKRTEKYREMYSVIGCMFTNVVMIKIMQNTKKLMFIPMIYCDRLNKEADCLFCTIL